MNTATPATGSASRHGPLWGARARTWAENEAQQVPTYDEGIRLAGIEAGMRVLDVGCGSGVFLSTAADRGVRVSGLDASEALAEMARRRVPDADVRVGDLQFLPHEDDSFDVVTGFNSFQFAADMRAALHEAGRVTRPGGRVAIQVWGRPEHCDLTAMLRAIGPLRPPPPAGAAPAAALSAPGVLEEIATAAGLYPKATADVSYAFEHPDERTMLARMLSAGAVVEAISHSGEDAVRAAVAEAMTPFRTPTGAYRLQNEWHFLVALA